MPSTEVVAYTGLIIAFIAALFTALQWASAHRSAAEAKRSADAAERSAKAAEESALSSARFAQNGQRSWVFLYSVSKPPRETLVTFGATLTFRNGGPTPATHLWIEALVGKFEEFPKEPPYPSDDHVARESVLGPLSNLDVPIARALSASEIGELKAGEFSFFLYGFVRYRDIFGDSHKTKYCLIFNPQQSSFVYHSAHNEIE
jgi:hypothetical protein